LIQIITLLSTRADQHMENRDKLKNGFRRLWLQTAY
jgi:hypothetical protein